MKILFENKNILMISYTSFIQKFYRTLPHEISRISGFKIKILVPPYWKEIWSKGKQYLEKIKNDRLDITEGNTFFTGNLHFAFFRNKLINILRSFQPDIIDLENEPFNFGSFQLVVCRNLFSKNSKILLHASQHEFKNYPFPFNLTEKFVLKNTDAILVRNSMARDVLLKKGFSGILEIVTHGIDTKAFKPTSKGKKVGKINPEKKPIIGYVGALAEHKGLRFLLEAAIDIDCKLMLIGDGPEKQSLIKQANQLSLDVDFISSQKHSKVAEYMNHMDIFVLPSLTRSNWVEKFGRVLIEAMSSGVPVIGSSSGEIPNVLGDAGLVFKEGDSKDLHQKIALLVENPELRMQYSQKARNHVVEKYSWKQIAKKTIDVYQKIL
jgi:glycosyltransferase involved in cell wall biosynthesis